MKKLFYLLLALPLVFAACEPDTPEQEPEYASELTLTSEAEMNFDATGGEGVITYTAKYVEVTREAPGPEASCEADWVTFVRHNVGSSLSFNVAANEGDARETKIVVDWCDKSFEVAVKQAATERA